MRLLLRTLRARPSALLLALLLLSVCARPLLQIATELHAAGHAGAGAPVALHAHADEHTHDGHEGDEAGKLWHALAHAAHCCSHVPLIDLGTSFALAPLASAAAPASRTRGHSSTAQAPELRPPISA